jgi:hypothetical protein
VVGAHVRERRVHCQKPPEPYDIAKLQLESEFEKFLEHPLGPALEAVTGAFAVGARHFGVSAGRMAQAILKGQMYEQFAYEMRTLREAGKLPKNPGATKHEIFTWAELMKIIDDECPDEERLDALKAAFYAVNKIRDGDADQIVSYQLWQITKELRSGDILLLHSMYTRVSSSAGAHARDWVAHMAKISGLVIPELVERYEKRLTDLLLMTPRVQVADDSRNGYLGSGINSVNNRLTFLGVRLCQNIEGYKIELGNARQRSE